MKRWLPWFLLAVFVAGLVVSRHSTNPGLLADSDTKVLLEAIRERQDPWSWFGGDWPLENHFYRPVSTLFFEFDNAVHGDDPAGYGLTNALISAGCILLAFWFFYELTGTGWLAGSASFLFGIWHFDGQYLGWVASLAWLGAVLVWLGLMRGGGAKFWVVLVASLGCVWLADMFFVPHGTDVGSRVVAWLPGRTASTMLLFALVAMGCYARYERRCAGRRGLPEPTALDLPATKGTVEVQAGRWDWVWLVGAGLGTVLALGCYEQAVVLPGVLTGIAVYFLTQRRVPHWGAVAVFWGLLVGYLVLRSQLVPGEVSGYQAQQFRSGPAVYLQIADFFFPAVSWASALWSTLTSGPFVLLTGSPWAMGALILANGAGLWIAWHDRERWGLFFAWSLALVTYLPMAWLKYFGHYLYWPMLFWALLMVWTVQALGRRLVSAIAPPAIQAPPRPDL